MKYKIKCLGLNCWFHAGFFGCYWAQSMYFFSLRCLWFFTIFLNDSARYAQVCFDPELGTQTGLDKYNMDNDDASSKCIYMSAQIQILRRVWRVKWIIRFFKFGCQSLIWRYTFLSHYLYCCTTTLFRSAINLFEKHCHLL